MADLAFPILSIGVVVPLVGTVVALLSNQQSQRRLASGLTAVSALCSFEALREVLTSGGAPLFEGWTLPVMGASQIFFRADLLNTVSMSLFSAIALATVIVAPRRDCGRGSAAGILLLLSGTLATFAAESLVMFVVGWGVGLLPFLLKRFQTDGSVPRSVRSVLLLSLAALIAGVVLTGIGDIRSGLPVPLAMSARRNPGTAGPVHWLLAAAAVMRTGLFPFHWWTVSLYARGPLLVGALALNAQPGAFLLARMLASIFPDTDHLLLPMLSNLGLFTSVYAAILGVIERNPRRLLALLTISQSSILLAGLTTASVAAINGALVHWFVMAVATTGLAGVYRAVEARLGGGVGADLGTDRFLGLATHFPRFAVYFAVSSLALAGLPGTLGFCSEDLLLHGSLQANPLIGIAMPLATALNAIQVFRLFSHLFLGRQASVGQGVPDALPRERWVLSAILLFLVLGGLAPSVLVRLQTPAAQDIAGSGTARHP
ncbi:MAG: hypothetical protein H7Y20_19470 [Bryobacteraceae bacterium]|nr:hypothetical protein [Bryobacteraceae bacterium]